ncbi:hypothetical protein L2Y94_02135 [Luteibacter aegosomatis]|uniref:hypothetical protein n=1 Tax=Luteibacter aegosomatis TaxID=2911537 RepID=UPI001FF94FF9|nr:hypothetical protein [Luteibacter aegosomatis]UPG86186.1 hypothetical protein L2Y94_02135 [Luteibacter aegosomatis]
MSLKQLSIHLLAAFGLAAAHPAFAEDVVVSCHFEAGPGKKPSTGTARLELTTNTYYLSAKVLQYKIEKGDWAGGNKANVNLRVKTFDESGKERSSTVHSDDSMRQDGEWHSPTPELRIEHRYSVGTPLKRKIVQVEFVFDLSNSADKECLTPSP